MSTEASPSRRRGSIEDGDSLLPPSKPTSAPSTSTSSAPTAAAPPAPAPSSDAPDADDDAEAAELAAMRARVAEMEAEAAKLRELTAASEAGSGGQGGGAGGEGMDVNMSDEDREAVDSRSIYVGNVRLPSSLATLSLSPSSAPELTQACTAPRRPHAGRLQLDARGDPAALCVVRHHQPRHDPVRQVHRAQRVRPLSLFPCVSRASSGRRLTRSCRRDRAQVRLRRVRRPVPRRQRRPPQRVHVPRPPAQGASPLSLAPHGVPPCLSTRERGPC